jgi:hypothetical protein
MSDPSSQLQHELENAVLAALTAHKPILFHINADTTWLLSLPYPENAICPTQRCRFNVLFDPWLKGPQSDVAGWFSTQWHKIQSSVQTIEELNRVLGEREELELSAYGRNSMKSSRKCPSGSTTIGPCLRNYIDVVVISHEFTDHCHRLTLEEVDASVPCFATTKAAELIRSWHHFEQVSDVPPFSKDSDWRTISASSLPPWMGIARLVTESDALYYHSAISVFYKSSNMTHPDAAEAVIYTPHGIQPNDLIAIPTASPPVQTVALLHGLHDVSITFTKQLNLGGHNALRCYNILRPRYWIGTHDEVKFGGGILAPFLRRKVYTLEDALKAEGSRGVTARPPGHKPIYAEISCGQSLLLE